MPLSAIGEDMGWGEALDLVQILRADPSSMLAAAVEGWDYPLARTDAILMDLYDLERHAAGDKKWRGYQRPYKTDQGDKTRRGNTAGRTRDEVIAILRKHGHGSPVPPV